MQILNVNTGHKKLDEAYKRIQVHISAYDDFTSFENYFNSITEGKDKEELFKWLLKVLFWEFKHGRESLDKQSDWDKLLSLVNDENKEQLESWLQTQLKQKEVNNR